MTDKAGLSEHIIIVGSGFGGLACAKALGGSRHRVTVIDRNNYHLFVPLLYQVATAALSPADIAAPIRMLLRKHTNIDVVLGDVVRVCLDTSSIELADGAHLGFDRLVLATGSETSYFAHPEWHRSAPGLRHLPDARQLRTRLLRGFEEAEHAADSTRQERLMTSVIVGGGPTGVEMAGAIAELARFTLSRDFRHIDPSAARVILLEAGPRILPAFPDHLAAYAHARLERLGVEIRCGNAVTNMTTELVEIGGEAIAANTILWAAGIRASPLASTLGIPLDRAGKIGVGPDLSVVGLDRIYALGDLAACTNSEDGQPLPALAQVAKQQGEYLGRALAGRSSPDCWAPFHYRSRGNTAIIGRSAAIFDFGRYQLKGVAAWLLWAIVHIYLLVSFEQKMLVSLQWLWRYFTYQRGARLIMGDEQGQGASIPK